MDDQDENAPGSQAQRSAAHKALNDLENQEQNGTAHENGDAGLTDTESPRQLHEARTVMQDLELQDADKETNLKRRATDPPIHPFWQRAAVYANLMTFSILGAATRIGLTRLCTYSGQSVFATAVSQAIGCAVMGLVARNKGLLENIDIALFVGLGTGYCGSVTTFSTWMLETFEAFSNANHYSRGGVHYAVDGLTQLFITFAVATAGLRFGIHTSSFLHVSLGPAKDRLPNTPRKHLLYAFFIIVAFLCELAMLLLTILVPSYRHVTFALLFAPFGTFLRFWLSKVNKYNFDFPRGTLAANLFATALLAACTVIQRRPGVSRLSCSVLQGFDDGFCGCLSTVSTFAVELRGLKRFPTYRYAAVSVVAGVALCVLIYGSVWWSIGLVPRCAFQT